MSEIAVTTDTGATLPSEIRKRLEVLVAPFTVVLNGRALLDGVDIEARAFFEHLRETEELPKTSMVRPRQWLEVFGEAADRTQEILCITVSETLSGTYQAARMAAQTLMDERDVRIEVIDSLTAGAAQGLLVGRAAEWARTMSLDEVIERVRDHLHSTNLFFMVDTLRYAAMGGRVSHLTSWVSDRLRLKPILSIKDGEVGAVDRPRTRRQGLQRLVETLQKNLKGQGELHVAVNHADSPDDAYTVMDRLRELLDPVSSWISDLTPVLGSHSGPGTIAVGSIETRE